jgi:hypothetical protein
MNAREMLAAQDVYAYAAAMRTSWALFLLFFTSGVLQAQQRSPWEGEWGSFTGGDMRQGRRLSIHDCQDAACRFSIESRSGSGNAGTASEQSFMIQSETTATATLSGETAKAVCTLRFERQMKPKPVIIVQAIGDTCTSYYSTSAAIRMEGIYPFRSATNYGGLHADECFLDNSPSRTAICTNLELTRLEQSWQELAVEYPLQPLTSKDGSIYVHSEQLNATILRACDSETAAATCLKTRYTEDIAAMQAKKDAFVDGTTQPGDRAKGGRLAAKIAGRYRHRFQNGNVQGGTFTSTDTLTIRPVGAASIHFEVELNFYNGHSCSLSGGALYRKDGSFVFDDSSANNDLANTPACRLAIVPSADGVKFNDINGGCRNYCGARGGWSGEGFTFKERVAASADPIKKKS